MRTSVYSQLGLASGRAHLEVLVLAAALFGVSGCTSDREATPAGPALSGAAAHRNVILVSVDTLRADRLGVSGHRVAGASPSPNIDRFLATGVRFDRALAPRAITWPSLASVLTGVYPSAHGVYENGYELVDGIPTLATQLSAEGYRTGRFLSNMCSANHRGWDQAFCSRGVDSKILPEVSSWLDDLDSTRPFLLWVHYFGAHSPYYNGGDRATRILDPGYQGPVAPKKGQLNRIMTESMPLNEADLRHLDALYDASVMGSDRFVGELLTEIERRGLTQDSVLIFLADHGEDLYDHHGYIYHACSVYQSGLHVPLAFVAPGLVEPGGVVTRDVELLDVTPTLLDLLGIDPIAVQHGVSLVPELERPGRGGDRPAFSEYQPLAIRTAQLGDWKLIDNPNHDSPYCLPGAPEGHYPLAPVELYHLADDPLETTNLAGQYPDKVEELRELIRLRFADLPTELTPQELPEELKRELEALGYVAN